MKHLNSARIKFKNHFDFLIVASVIAVITMHQSMFSASTTAGQCNDVRPIKGESDNCKCSQTIRTYPANEIIGKCDFENGLGYTVGAGTTCVSNTPSGFVVCKPKFVESGEYFKCEPKKDWGAVWTCFGTAAVDLGACLIELPTGPGGWALCGVQTALVVTGPCGPCTVFPCQKVVTAPNFQSVAYFYQECPPPKG
jgi:hypothetical protein